MIINEDILNEVNVEVLLPSDFIFGSQLIDELSGMAFDENENPTVRIPLAANQDFDRYSDMEVQRIDIDGSLERFVVVRESTWLELLRLIGNPARGCSPSLVKAILPPDVSSKILGGLNPVVAIRTWRNLTARDLAQRVGETPSAISQIEHGRIQPSLSTLQKLAQCLRVPYQILLSVSCNEK